MEAINNIKNEFVELTISMKNDIDTIIERMYNDEGFVTCNNEYIYVGKGNGLNDTEVNVSTSSTDKNAVVFPCEDLAKTYMMDLRIIHEDGKREVFEVMSATDFFRKSIKKNEELVAFIEGHIKH